MDSFDYAGRLASEPLVALCCSSGAAGIPSNGQRFHDWLAGLGDARALMHMRFAMFGLGDKRFGEAYLHTPREVREALLAHGATEFLPMGDGDESSGGYAPSLEQWAPRMLDLVSSMLVLPAGHTGAVVTGAAGGASGDVSSVTVAVHEVAPSTPQTVRAAWPPPSQPRQTIGGGTRTREAEPLEPTATPATPAGEGAAPESPIATSPASGDGLVALRGGSCRPRARCPCLTLCVLGWWSGLRHTGLPRDYGSRIHV